MSSGRDNTQAQHGYALAMLKRELILAYRKRGDLANPLLFFVMVISLVPLGISPDSSLLALLGSGMIWVVALLASLLSMDSLFRGDYEDGSLEQLLLMPQALLAPVLMKILAHWLMTGVPLALIAPLLAVMLSVPGEALGVLLLSLLVGTACFSLVGAIGAALTVALRRASLLLSLVVIPLYIPVLIFGTAAVHNAASGLSSAGPLAILGAFLALAIALAPFAIIAGLRIGVDG